MSLGVKNDMEVAQSRGEFFSCSQIKCRGAARAGGSLTSFQASTLFLRHSSPKSGFPPQSWSSSCDMGVQG